MARIESRLTSLGLALSPPITPPPGVALPFRSVRERALPIIAIRVDVEAKAHLAV